jgi:hypothetical protein
MDHPWYFLLEKGRGYYPEIEITYFGAVTLYRKGLQLI